MPQAAAHTDLEPGLGRQFPEHADPDDDRCTRPEADAPSESLECVRRRAAVDLHLVDTLDGLLAGDESCGERAVVGHEEKAARLQVEPADRIEPLRHTAHEIADGGTALGIRHGGDDTARLVQQDGEPRPGRVETLAVDADDVALWIGTGAELTHDLPVDRDTARRDELLGVPA
jgi:hypothetical protein